MKEGDPLVTTAFEAYRAEAFGVDRIDPATFYRVVTAHFMRPFAALDETGAFRGYVTVKEGGETVNEIFKAVNALQGEGIVTDEMLDNFRLKKL